MRTYKFIVEKTNTGFSAYAENFEALPVATTGKSMAELNSNIVDATNLYLDYIGKAAINADCITIRT